VTAQNKIGEIEDMTVTEEVRAICLRNRRRCQRILRQTKGLAKHRRLDPERRAKLLRNIAYFETCVMLTKPSWVKKASLDELMPVLKHLTRAKQH
jgi:hypothetical protein